MHPINKILSYFGWQLYRSKRQAGIPWEFRRSYAKALAELKEHPPAGFKVFSEIMYEVGQHPETYVDFECEFAAKHISRMRPNNILDIGSYRHFIIGLLAHFRVTTVDVRGRQPILANETVITGDAKRLALSDNLFEMVVSLCAIEHFGLGRYGDVIDMNGDRRALLEMARVLKPGGRLIITTEITRGEPAVAFNAHRIYSREMIRKMCEDAGLEMEEESFFCRRTNATCDFNDVATAPKLRDIYAGCWKKR